MLSRITQWFSQKVKQKESTEEQEEVLESAAYAHRIFEELHDKFNSETDTLIAPMYMNELLGVLLNDEQWGKTVFVPNAQRLSIIRVGLGRNIPEEIDINL